MKMYVLYENNEIKDVSFELTKAILWKIAKPKKRSFKNADKIRIAEFDILEWL